MRALYYTISIFLITVLSSACSTDKSASYRSFYASANKEYAAATSISEARIAAEAEQARKSEMKKKQAQGIESESIQITVESDGNGAEGNNNGSAASTSAANTAKANQAPQPVATTQPVVPQKPVEKAPAKTESQTTAPATNKNTNSDDLKGVFRKGKIVAEEGYEDQLKKYSVVVASLSKIAGVERLKAAFEESGEPFLVAKNDKGIYYFILGSYDDREEAIEKRAEVREKYVNRYSRAELIKRYAIPFSDVWIIVNE